MSTVSQGKAFELDVVQLLELKGYKVTRNNLINGTQIDIVASRNDLLENTTLVVECTDRDAAVGVDLVKEKSAVLLSLRGGKSHFRLMFVARNGFSAEAKTFADSQPDTLLLTFAQLENLLVDFTPYVNWYRSHYERSLGVFKDAKLIDRYVDLSGRDEKGQLIASLDSFAREWLANEKNNLLFLLGDYGAGKTSFSRQFAYRLLREKFDEHGTGRYTPLLISLRDSHGQLDLKRLLLESLTNLYGVELQSFMAFERLCATGRVLVLLDGFDEMTERSDFKTITDAFQQIYLFAALDAKIILTCRSNFFRSHADVIELLRQFSISVPTKSDGRSLELPLKDQGKLVYVEKLNDAQIRAFIAKRFGGQSDEILASIRRIHDLSDLCTRPVLLDMILSTLPELERLKRKINSAALYQHYTDRWTMRDQWRVTIPLKVRTIFCESLAWLMHCANATAISSATLETTMVAALGPIAGKNRDDLAKFQNDIQTCSFLVRVGEKDEFRFAHKSFSEFFVARKLVADLMAGTEVQRADTTGVSASPSHVVEKKRTGTHQPTEKRPDILRVNVTDFVIDAPVTLTFNSGGGKYSLFENIRASLNDRLRSTDFFQAMHVQELSHQWPYISSDTAVRSHLEAEIRAIFAKQWRSSLPEDITISEEIATFALEHMGAKPDAFAVIVAKLRTARSIDVFSDLVRLSKSADWVQQNASALRDYVRNGKYEQLKTAAAAALARHPEPLTLEFVREIKTSLPEGGWSYFLFQLAEDGPRYADVLGALSLDETIAPVDRVICLYGLGGQLPSDKNHERLARLVVQLLRSKQSSEQRLATRVFSTFTPEQRLAILAEGFKDPDPGLRKILLALTNAELEGIDWRRIRALAVAEQNAEIRKEIYALEETIRNFESERQNRASWDRSKNSRNLRESLWQSRLR
ncbi:restriction endonuclease [Opitutus terrae]|nr:restriction endonuclease [Opitutus terrae]